MDIHLVRVPQYVDVVNVKSKSAKLVERPDFFSVHVDRYKNDYRILAAIKGTTAVTYSPKVVKVYGGMAGLDECPYTPEKVCSLETKEGFAKWW